MAEQQRSLAREFEPAAASAPAEDAPAGVVGRTPLYVDLSGTLVATDLLWESFLALVRTRPLDALLTPLRLAMGQTRFQAWLADRVELDMATLPYRADVLAYLEEEKRKGRKIVLTTSADERLARRIADYLGIFESLIASSRDFNCTGEARLRAIQADSGRGGFDYIGHSIADLPVWKSARKGFVVSSNKALLRAMAAVSTPARVFDAPVNQPRAMLKAVRPHQWVKNLLVLVPVVLAHKLFDLAHVIPGLIGLVAFCLSASAVYLVNDLLDLPADRNHPRNKNRPLATGKLSIPVALVMTAALLLAAVLLCLTLPRTFAGVLVLYLILTTCYSVFLKRKLMVDVIALAGLYTLRVLAGGQATGDVISPWLMGFSTFFFLSLAFVKRYVELDTQFEQPGKIGGRGYFASDIDMIRSLGPTSSYMCILVIALYISSPEVQHLYRRPWLLWVICPVLLYWISRIWFLAHRHEMVHDPVVFALTDKQSYLTGLLLGLTLLLAAI
jgi:4-hydroxybenzoate polyprenyltransferase